MLRLRFVSPNDPPEQARDRPKAKRLPGFRTKAQRVRDRFRIPSQMMYYRDPLRPKPNPKRSK